MTELTKRRQETYNTEYISDATHSGTETRAYDVVKRIADIFLSLIMLAISSPVLLIICIVNAVYVRGNPLFFQRRVKKGGKMFTIIKFRTMVKNADEKIRELSDEARKQYELDFRIDNDPRITAFGRFLRSTCIDELPQLLNVIKGDMSLVGPRPVLSEETYFYGEQRDLFLSVRPGLTGYWQAYTTEKRSYSDCRRQKMELYYIDNRSILLDIKIILKTVATVIIRLFIKR